MRLRFLRLFISFLSFFLPPFSNVRGRELLLLVTSICEHVVLSDHKESHAYSIFSYGEVSFLSRKIDRAKEREERERDSLRKRYDDGEVMRW